MIYLLLSLFFLSDTSIDHDFDIQEIGEMQERIQNISMKDSVLRHVVLFGFTSEATEADIDNIEKSFAGLATKIDGIVDFEWGINSSPEGLDQGHTHCFIVSFDSEASRDTYLPHPDHKAFVDLAGPFIEKVTVIDYWTGDN